MLKRHESFPDTIERLFGGRVLNFTFQVTDDCNLACRYCYQTHKGHRMMRFDTAKQAIDLMFRESHDPESIFSHEKNRGIVFEFIGGEPLMNIGVTRKIMDYVEEKMDGHPWQMFHRFSFCSNGVLFFSPEVQRMLRDYDGLVSFGITVDGDRELHDSCRVHHDGTGSYDEAIRAALYLKEHYGSDETKITLCPENIAHTSKAVINMLTLGFPYVWANCVYEEGWTAEHAKILYRQMKDIADYVLEHDLEDRCNVSLFDPDAFGESTDDQNWCGGTGKMLSMDADGYFYPCTRYMESSLGGAQPPVIVGSVRDGVYQRPEHKAIYEELCSITKTSQSEEKCVSCPIAGGCSWCSAYNYQVFGTANRRATFICVMHQARALGTAYYCMMESRKKRTENGFRLRIPKEWALEIVSEEEYQMLKEG